MACFVVGYRAFRPRRTNSAAGLLQKRRAIVSGTHRADDVLQMLSFISAQVLGVIWGIYFVKEARKTRAHSTI
jgi:hypothetical protein